MYDSIIIGGGPAGLTAALYARRANKTVLVIEKGTFGGQITFSPKVENIPGFALVTGNEFAEKLVEQVLALEAEVECAEVLSIKDGEVKTVVTDSGEFQAKTSKGAKCLDQLCLAQEKMRNGATVMHRRPRRLD